MKESEQQQKDYRSHFRAFFFTMPTESSQKHLIETSRSNHSYIFLGQQSDVTWTKYTVKPLEIGQFLRP